VFTSLHTGQQSCAEDLRPTYKFYKSHSLVRAVGGVSMLGYLAKACAAYKKIRVLWKRVFHKTLIFLYALYIFDF